MIDQEPTSFQAEPEFVSGQIVTLGGSARNLAELREALERERSAVQAAEVMSEFMATVSHEIRTPLNAVLGMAQAMGRGELSAPQRERLAVIEKAGATLLAVLGDLLDLSKIEAGAIELEDGVVDTQDLANGARATFASLVQDKDVGFHLAMAPSAVGCWVGDPKRIRQVVHNLITNAVKFTDHGSVGIAFSYASERLILRVHDTGRGIPPDRLADVFERCVQADASTTPRHGESGLGLSVCRDLVSLMSGDIRAESTHGVGSDFIVSLPLTRAAASRPSESPDDPAFDASPTKAELRVLAAEDNVTNQLILKTLLGEVGIDPVLVSNGQEALDALRTGTWDIVLMDIQMPVMDGLTAVKLLRESERREGLHRTPVIAVTANAMAHQKAEYLAADIDALVPKPIDLGCLLRTIDEALGSAETPRGPQSSVAH